MSAKIVASREAGGRIEREIASAVGVIERVTERLEGVKLRKSDFNCINCGRKIRRAISDSVKELEGVTSEMEDIELDPDDFQLSTNEEPNGISRLRPMPGDSPDRLADCIESMAKSIVGNPSHGEEHDWLREMELIADEVRRLKQPA